MNNLTIIGNLTKDPELRSVQTASGMTAVCSFTVAVNRKGKSNEADFIRVSAWGKLAEVCSKYLSKGKKVYAAGEAGAHAYTTQKGETRAEITLNARDVEFLSPKNSETQDFTPVEDADMPWEVK